MSSNLTPYVLQHGKHVGMDYEQRIRRTFVPGEVVLLSPSQAKSFADKFKSVAVVEAEARVAQVQVAASHKAKQIMEGAGVTEDSPVRQAKQPAKATDTTDTIDTIDTTGSTVNTTTDSSSGNSAPPEPDSNKGSQNLSPKDGASTPNTAPVAQPGQHAPKSSVSPAS